MDRIYCLQENLIKILILRNIGESLLIIFSLVFSKNLCNKD